MRTKHTTTKVALFLLLLDYAAAFTTMRMMQILLPPPPNVYTIRDSQMNSKIGFDENSATNQNAITEACGDSRDRDSVLSRRSLLNSIGSKALPFSFIAITQNAGPSLAASKAKGAAEYDFEFYMRNLIQGNNDKEGNIQASAPPPAAPSRSLMSTSNPGFIQNIINDDLSDDCVTIRTLSKITDVPAKDISQLVSSFRSKVEKSFFTRVPWKNESMNDEYYFDLTAYSLYRTAATLIPNDYKLRDQWVREVGQEIYAALSANIKGSSSKPAKLTDTIPIMQELLQAFQSNNFIDSYQLGDKNDDARTGSKIFDTYDDEDIEAGLTLNCLISLKRPATLTSSLQIVGEGSRFMPEFIGTTVAAMWRKELGLKVEYETYFVDEEYRPNPKDYFPSEQLLQYTLKK